MCWNLSAEEAETLFLDITRPQHVNPGSAKAGKPEPEPPATHVTKEQYLLGARSAFCTQPLVGKPILSEVILCSSIACMILAICPASHL
jgi:transcriptional regulator of nitric oxide reductase